MSVSDTDLSAEITSGASELGVDLADQQAEKLLCLISLLQEWNERFNLTSIRDEQGILRKHVLDSLALASQGWIACSGRAPSSLLDVGSGAGFPALPLAAVFPQINVTALESVRKKAEFISLAASQLALDVRVVRGRAETQAQRSIFRERFDLVTARAVAYLPTLAEYCLPFVRPGGHFVAMKSESLDEEIADGIVAVERLGGLLQEPLPYTISGVPGRRWLLVAEKVTRTPSEYPREPGVPSKRPLV